MILVVLSWYLVVQLLAVIALPLALRLFDALPDRGYAFAKILGILLVGFVFWWGYSYGLLRNDAGGAWISVIIVAIFSAIAGRHVLSNAIRRRRLSIRGAPIITIEILFLAGFLLWTLVRAYDPAANHTEQPMDLMFMNSIWASTDYPPQDAWFAGYAISYYYFGYWLLTTLGRLSGQAPAIAYTLGQACWFGLLLIGSFGVVYNLLAWRCAEDRASDSEQDGIGGHAVVGGLLAALIVAVTGNGQVILEWLYANGWPIDGLASWVAVDNFPANAGVTNEWFISNDWWWWRSGRVLEDLDLMGNHIEVIAEFPMFSYLLGDNHPHVLAMPVVLLVIGLAMNVVVRGVEGLWRRDDAWWDSLLNLFPARWLGLLIVTIASGALLFLNTWDYPPYWALLVASIFVAAFSHKALVGENGAFGTGIGVAIIVGAILAVGAVLFYLPYLLTAQSQAGGFLPNLFNPTRFPQFLLFFGIGLCTLIVLIVPVWSRLRPAPSRIGITFAFVYGVPIIFLVMSAVLATTTPAGEAMLARLPLPSEPPNVTNHAAMIVQRWSTEPWTFLLAGGLLALVLVLIWSALDQIGGDNDEYSPPTLFALLLAALGLMLVYTPEFIFLRDNFGARMNTIFKFYYQGWLLFGLSGSYAIVQAWRGRGRMAVAGRTITTVATVFALLLVLGGLLFPIAGVYSKTVGFRNQPTLDATAYIAYENNAELAAARWVLENTAPDALVLEGMGVPYWATYNRISTLTGRPTILGWEGHERQWRGREYDRMAVGRQEALQAIYTSGLPRLVTSTVNDWGIDYVYIGPTERSQYGITPATEAAIANVMDLVFEDGDVRIYQRRGAQ